jgi:hypothetical protein
MTKSLLTLLPLLILLVLKLVTANIALTGAGFG